MAFGNQTFLAKFTFLGFSDLSLSLQLLLFVVFLKVYAAALLGNVLIIALTTVCPALQTPMYFFLRNLSFLEICYTSVTIPKMLVDLLVDGRGISLWGCVTQLYFFIFLGTTECYFLAVMAFDRYVAVCNPLHYTAIMNGKLCVRLSAAACVGAMVLALGQACLVSSLKYCGSTRINHFFCEVPVLVRLACGDKHVAETGVSVHSIFVGIIPFLLIITSYVPILSAILGIHSTEGRHKAFSTCASHLVSVVLFYSTGIFAYVLPKIKFVSGGERLLALMYAVVIPMLNPLIYSLRNKEVKGALRRKVSRKLFSEQR
ncbi:olfactory receptor 10A4-like [Rhinatrema bivittatum]|uniref:olfactory receptor 10A4-like n=1 Tax=Rhinatrema bivittatum TaxID=194408 RepID=UPI00112B751E|nr:olfactory receptor 10A4-like [Rhinatrema bivittatum]